MDIIKKLNRNNIANTIVLTLVFSLINCGGAETTKTFESCITIDISDQESASYTFTQGSVTDVVSVKADEISNGFNISYTVNNTTKTATITNDCGKVTNGTLTRQAGFILFGGFQWIQTKDAENQIVVADWQSSCQQQSESIIIGKKNYSVQKCTLTPRSNNLNIVKVIRYTKNIEDGITTKPFSGVIKETIFFRDSTEATVLLTDWNTL